MSKYHLIPMNMDKFNIDDMIRLNGCIEWNNGNEFGKNIHTFEKGDVVYIYCTNLPDGSRRVLFRAEVVNVNNRRNHQNTFTIDNLTTIKLRQKNCIRKEYDYSYENLIIKYNFKVNQRMRYLESDEMGIKLKGALERDYKHSVNKKIGVEALEEVRDYFNNEIWCECCKILIKYNNFTKDMANNRTFIKNDGLRFYESHHLLMQNILRKDKVKNKDWFRDNKWYDCDNDKDMINDDYNCIILCPVCHAELHHGDNDEYKKKYGIKKETVINQLMDIHQFDKKLKTFNKTPEEIKSIRRYVLQQYVKVTNKYVFENIINNILDDKSLGKNKKLINLLEKYDEKENKSCYENGNYIKIENINSIGDDYILDINVNRENRLKILDKLGDILNDNSK